MSSSYWKYKNKSKQFAPSKNDTQPQQPPKKSIHKWTYGRGTVPDQVKIATWNVNGIRSVYNRRFLQPYLQKNNIDILCVNQTKIDQLAYEKAPITLHGYSGYWNFCKCSAGYSGVAVFSRFLPISMQEDLPQSRHCHQGRTIILQFQKFYLVSVYVPNSGSKLQRLPYRVNQFDIDFQKHIQNLREKKHVVVAGDLNVVRDEIDIYKSEGKTEMSTQMPACTPQERKNLENMLNLGYIDSFRQMHPEKVQYTWWNMKIEARKRNIGWRIDYILINLQMKDALIDSIIQDQVMGSDHCPVEVCLDLSQISSLKKVTQPALKQEGLKIMGQNFQGQEIEFKQCFDVDEFDEKQYNSILKMYSKLIEKKKQCSQIRKQSQVINLSSNQEKSKSEDKNPLEAQNKPVQSNSNDGNENSEERSKKQEINNDSLTVINKKQNEDYPLNIVDSESKQNENKIKQSQLQILQSPYRQPKQLQKATQVIEIPEINGQTEKKIKREPIKFQTLYSQQMQLKKRHP